MSRTLDVRLGSLPLSTLQANIDYGFAEAFMSGAIGIKVWVYKGMYEQGAVDETESEGGGRSGTCPRPSVIELVRSCVAALNTFFELECDVWR